MRLPRFQFYPSQLKMRFFAGGALGCGCGFGEGTVARNSICSLQILTSIAQLLSASAAVRPAAIRLIWKEISC